MVMPGCVHTLIEVTPEPDFALNQAQSFDIAELCPPVGLGLANLSKPILSDHENIVDVAAGDVADQPGVQPTAGVSDDVKNSSLRPIRECPGHHSVVQVDLENGIRLFEPPLASDPPWHQRLA